MQAISSSSLAFPNYTSVSSERFSRLNAFVSFRKSALSVKCRRTDTSNMPPQPSSFRSQSPEGQTARVFVGHYIYKGKAALTVEPKSPEFTSLDSGAYKISKEGFILLQFAPAVAARQYDWSRKQVFSLSVPEIGMLMSLGEKDSCEFFHDPFKGRNLRKILSKPYERIKGFMKRAPGLHINLLFLDEDSSEEGKIRKLLKVEPLPDGSGHFFNLRVQNSTQDVEENVYIPITRGEFAVLKSAFNFIIPYLLGWHTFGKSIKPEDSLQLNNNHRSDANIEWSR